MLGGAAISWASKKQTIISISTIEYELIALDTTCTEAKWLRNLLLDMPIMSKPIPAISIQCDCKAVIDLIRQSHTNRKMNRHMQVRYKYIKGLVNKNVVSVNFVRSKKNMANGLTKGLPQKGVYESSRGMELSP